MGEETWLINGTMIWIVCGCVHMLCGCCGMTYLSEKLSENLGGFGTVIQLMMGVREASTVVKTQEMTYILSI
jgi:hypothetical protein